MIIQLSKEIPSKKLRKFYISLLILITKFHSTGILIGGNSGLVQNNEISEIGLYLGHTDSDLMLGKLIGFHGYLYLYFLSWYSYPRKQTFCYQK